MKRFLAIILCLCIILTGCHSKFKENQNNKTNGNVKAVTTAMDTKKTDSTKLVTKLLTLNEEWSLVKTFDTFSQVYEEPAVNAHVTPYTVKKDLSNIKNIGQFSGFNKQQKKMLAKNGFVVVPDNNTKIYYPYDSNEYQGVPNFITSDCALHLYHQFYDKSLMNVETVYLYQDLDFMTKQMLEHSILLWQELKDDDLKALEEKNIVYFLVARMLFTQTYELSTKVDQRLKDLAEQEYELCQAAKGYQKSPLFGTDFDYSQFKVRGHYTRSKELSQYFKTMMWFGFAPLALTDQDGKLLIDNILQSLLMTFTVFADSNVVCDAKLWTDIYQPTSKYVE